MPSVTSQYVYLLVDFPGVNCGFQQAAIKSLPGFQAAFDFADRARSLRMALRMQSATIISTLESFSGLFRNLLNPTNWAFR